MTGLSGRSGQGEERSGIDESGLMSRVIGEDGADG